MMNDVEKQRGDAARGEPAGAEAAVLFRGLAKMVYHSDDFHEVYNALCRSAPTLVTGCDHASLMLLRDNRFATVAASDDIGEYIDGMERELGEGPCVDSIEQEAGYVEPSLQESSQWPELSRRIVAETPVRGVAGFRLLIDNQKVGALNLFSDTPGGLTAQSVNEAAVVTSFVSIALMAAHGRATASSLRDGLDSNREIGKAIGLMMAFHKVDDRAAFEMLRRASQDMNMKLAQVAREFVAHHNARRD